MTDDTAAGRPAEDRAARPKRGEVRVEARVYTPHRRHVLVRTLDVDQANDPRYLVELTLKDLAREIADEWQDAAGAHREQVERRRTRRAAAKDQPQRTAYSAEAAASAAKAGQSEGDALVEGTDEDEDETSVSSGPEPAPAEAGVVQKGEPIAIVVPTGGEADDTDDGPERAPDLLDEIAGTAPAAGPRR